jgi:hypothetical protein
MGFLRSLLGSPAPAAPKAEFMKFRFHLADQENDGVKLHQVLAEGTNAAGRATFRLGDEAEVSVMVISRYLDDVFCQEACFYVLCTTDQGYQLLQRVAADQGLAQFSWYPVRVEAFPADWRSYHSPEHSWMI